MLRSALLVCHLAGALATSVRSSSGTTVQIRNGTVSGNSTAGIDAFFGIPYARPPVAELRLQPPQTIEEAFGHLILPGTIDKVPACTNMIISSVNLSAMTNIPEEEQADYYNIQGDPDLFEQEDCLSLNIQRPTNIQSGKKLPVLFWIYGGGWEIGTTQWYDASSIVNLSMSMNEPVIFVAANYRLNAFGFLQGKELQAEGATNLGLRDQRKALEWVAENIESFGGDPNKVTIWGESAGALSVYDHLTIFNGDNKYDGRPLFHGAIMNSGVAIATQSAVSTRAQEVFDSMASYAGCSPDSYNNGSAILSCLRQVPYDIFKAAMNLLPNFGGSQSNNLAYIRRPDPASDFYSRSGVEAARTGQYARVPVIMGNMQDEATVFTPGQMGVVNDTDSLVDYFASWYTEAPRNIVEEFIATYDSAPSQGLPAGAGSRYEIYPQSKRNAAIQTDVTFGMGRRIVLANIASQVPSWSYLATYLHGNPWWGSYHTADLATQFSLATNTYAGTKMDEAYIHFVNYQNPNGKPGACKEWWPQWDRKDMQMANFSKSDVGITKDNYRWESYEYLRKHMSQFKQ